jgi:hypothetical protein
VEQAAKHERRIDRPDQILARLASLFAFAFDVADLKAASDEITEVDPADNDLPPGFAASQIDAVLG